MERDNHEESRRAGDSNCKTSHRKLSEDVWLQGMVSFLVLALLLCYFVPCKSLLLFTLNIAALLACSSILCCLWTYVLFSVESFCKSMIGEFLAAKWKYDLFLHSG